MADYLEKKYNSQTISLSKPLRDILDRLYLSQTRKNMSDLGIFLRKNFGKDILGRTITKEVIISKKPIVCLPNIRLDSDIVQLKKLPNFILVHIDTNAKTRHKRLTKRSQNPDDKTKTWLQFIKDSKMVAERKIRVIAKRAKYKIDNNGTHKELHTQIDDIMNKILNIKK